jgi:hypothetical protein
MADHIRRRIIKGAAAASAFAAVGPVAAQVRSDGGPQELDGKQMPEPPTERSAGPIRPGRGSMLQQGRRRYWRSARHRARHRG